jgi:hypothetical protein
VIKLLPILIRRWIYSLIETELSEINEKTVEAMRMRIKLAIHKALGLN